VARKSKADAAGLEKIRKTKATVKPVPVKAKKKAPLRKRAVAIVETERTLVTTREFDPTNDQIQMRAYFISERRRRFDLPGDANSDWLEAKRQLRAEVHL